MKTPSGRRASSCSRYIAHREGKLAEILGAYGQHVEGAELNFFVMLARMERVEIRDDVNIERDGLAIENELPQTLPCRKASALYLRAGAFCVVHSAGRHVEFVRGDGLGQMVEVAQPIVRCGEVCGVDRHCVRER